MPRPSMQGALAVLAMLMFGLLVGSLLFRVVPDQNRELVSTAMGFLAGNMVGPAFQWFFGSTAGSEKKTQALADAVKSDGGTSLNVQPPAHIEVTEGPEADPFKLP
jgi:hypothetical protein